MKNNTMLIVVAGVVVVVILGVFLSMNRTSRETPPSEGILERETPIDETESPRGTVVLLDIQNNSGESGIATLSESDGKTLVTLALDGAPAGVTQPAHIHTGSCETIGGVKYPLTFPIDGVSETLLGVSFDQLLGELPLAINVHKSVAEASVYVSCGDVTETGIVD